MSEKRYFRVRHDLTIKEYGYDVREFGPGFDGLWYPAVFPCYPTPKGGEAAFKISPEWFRYLAQGQSAFIRGIANGYFNDSTNPKWDFKDKDGKQIFVPLDWNGNPYLLAEVLGCTGALFRGTVKSGSLMLDHFTLADEPQGDFFHTPWAWVKGSSIAARNSKPDESYARKGDIGLWNGDDVTFPLLAKEQVYMPLDYLEELPALPFAGFVISASGVNVRQFPTVNAQKVNRLSYGTSIIIQEYHFWGPDVWGRLDGTDVWICLCYALPNRAGFDYFTTWKMETNPPLGTRARLEQPLSDFTGVVVEPPAEEPGDVPYPGASNQMVINALYAAAEALDYANGWQLVLAAGLEHLVDDRQALYTGPKIDEIKRLARFEQQLVLQDLLGRAGLSLTGTYGLTSNQMVINAFYKAAGQYGESGWDWIESAGLVSELVGDDAVRPLVYRGPEMNTLKGKLPVRIVAWLMWELA